MDASSKVLKVTTPSIADIFEKAKKFAHDSAEAKGNCNFVNGLL